MTKVASSRFSCFFLVVIKLVKVEVDDGLEEQARERERERERKEENIDREGIKSRFSISPSSSTTSSSRVCMCVCEYLCVFHYLTHTHKYLQVFNI